MIFEFNFYSSLLLIFFVHGLVYSVLCFRKSITTGLKSFFWLALLLLLGALYISAWMLGFAGWYDNEPFKHILLYTPTNYSWALGPVMFIYLQHLLNPAYRFQGKQWWHLLPICIYLLLHVALLFTDILAIVSPPVLVEEIDPDYTDYIQLPGMLITIAYSIVAIRYYRLYRKLMVQVISFADRVAFRWVRNFLVAFFTYALINVMFEIIGTVTNVDYIGSWWYYIAFAIIFYYIAISGYSNTIATSVAYRPNLLSYRPAIYLQFHSGENSTNSAEELAYISMEDTVPVKPSALSAEDLLLSEKIIAAMEMQKAYEDPSLSLLSLSQLTGTNPTTVSRIINTALGKNFNDFVNGYRVEALIQLLIERRHNTETLLSLAFEVGFNSKATFNRAFQKHTGSSPKAWLAENNL